MHVTQDVPWWSGLQSEFGAKGGASQFLPIHEAGRLVHVAEAARLSQEIEMRTRKGPLTSGSVHRYHKRH